MFLICFNLCSHLGNLGDLILNSNGKFDHALIASLDVDIEGEKNIVGYPIVVSSAITVLPLINKDMFSTYEQFRLT